MNRLSKIDLTGFKSIQELKDFELMDLNVIIGANGAGKSNLVDFFRMLSWMINSPGNLQHYIGMKGGANSFLHEGAAKTLQIGIHLTISTDTGTNEYEARLSHAAGDTLIFAEEKCRFSRIEIGAPGPWVNLEVGHKESHLFASEHQTAKVVHNLLRGIKVHQFHDTSDTARVKTRWAVEDCRNLKEDGGNLAPFLFNLRETKPAYYKRIVDTIRLALPFFGDFILSPEYGKVLLSWSEIGSDLIFGPHQGSDGSLRLFLLFSLLLQPEDSLPDVLILDEPELGLHPYAMTLLGEMIRSASKHCQILLCTQSMTLLDQFEMKNVVVVDREGRASKFHRLQENDFKEWLADYSMSELWEKNVLGGRPA